MLVCPLEHVNNERNVLKLTMRQIVPEMSARFGTENDQAVGLDADHLQICKFRDATTSSANRVLQTFEAISRQILVQSEIAGMITDMPSPPEQSNNDQKTLVPLEDRLAKLRS